MNNGGVYLIIETKEERAGLAQFEYFTSVSPLPALPPRRKEDKRSEKKGKSEIGDANMLSLGAGGGLAKGKGSDNRPPGEAPLGGENQLDRFNQEVKSH